MYHARTRRDLHTNFWLEYLNETKWQDNIKRDRREIGWEDVDWINVV
jgi:hypothetical protein